MAPDETHRIGIRFPTELHIRAANQAERRDISINQFVIECVQAAFTAHDKRQPNPEQP